MFGARLVWVVHETSPHDRGRPANWSSRAFLKSLDGAIYLSHASRCAGEADIAELSDIPALVTRHGHYRIAMERPPQPRRAPGARLELVYFGQIRPYKNLDSLLSAARGLSPDDVRLKLIGWSKDPEFTRLLERLAAKAPAVSLDIRESLVPQLDIEEALDAADGVFLPYRRILNSGAALFALSRNRPILAPRLGTLPELRDEIGAEWVDLYDSEAVTTDILAGFGARLREQGAPTADLSSYDWGPIGESIGRFFDHLSKASIRSSSSHLQTGSETPWR
jgi:glycosyltransferase involved in cell wall biosynthesis